MFRDKTYRIHLLCWTIYIAYEILLTGILNGRFSHPLTYIFFYSIEIGLFYVHALIIMPRLFRAHGSRYILEAVLLASLLCSYTILLVLSSNFLELVGVRKRPLTLDGAFFLYLCWRAVLFLMYATGFFFVRRYIQQTAEQARRSLDLERMRTKMAQLESDYLRSQISPHLLFNTLNFIKFAAKHRPEQSEEAILLLTQTLDFSLSKSQHGLIPLREELNQVENIIRINQLRYDGKVTVELLKELEVNGKLVPPISILTIVENIYKHGDLLKEKYPARLSITEQQDSLTIKTENLIASYPDSQDRGRGSGLTNLKERMESFYGERNFFLEYGKHGRYFRLELTIPTTWHHNLTETEFPTISQRKPNT